MILGWIGALFIGLSLGLLGSGGSILTVPVLVYLFGQDEKLAIASSLAIVGTIAFAGGLDYWHKRLIDWKAIILFGIPSMLASYLGAFLAVYLSGIFQLVIFAFIMFIAAVFMFRNNNLHQVSEQISSLKIISSGVGVGVMTGIIGIGGGFLIVPSLILFAGLAMRGAIATSLVIITLNAYTGFFKYLQVLALNNIQLDWMVIITVSTIGIIGTFIGHYLCHKIPQAKLKYYFAYFILLMAVFILFKELPKVF